MGQEFKQKLKDEYLNLGGSPNRVRVSHRGCCCMGEAVVVCCGGC